MATVYVASTATQVITLTGHSAPNLIVFGNQTQTIIMAPTLFPLTLGQTFKIYNQMTMNPVNVLDSDFNFIGTVRAGCSAQVVMVGSFNNAAFGKFWYFEAINPHEVQSMIWFVPTAANSQLLLNNTMPARIVIENNSSNVGTVYLPPVSSLVVGQKYEFYINSIATNSSVIIKTYDDAVINGGGFESGFPTNSNLTAVCMSQNEGGLTSWNLSSSSPISSTPNFNTALLVLEQIGFILLGILTDGIADAIAGVVEGVTEAIEVEQTAVEAVTASEQSLDVLAPLRAGDQVTLKSSTVVVQNTNAAAVAEAGNFLYVLK